jgi:hypothetical protein
MEFELIVLVKLEKNSPSCAKLFHTMLGLPPSLAVPTMPHDPLYLELSAIWGLVIMPTLFWHMWCSFIRTIFALYACHIDLEVAALTPTSDASALGR